MGRTSRRNLSIRLTGVVLLLVLLGCSTATVNDAAQRSLEAMPARLTPTAGNRITIRLQFDPVSEALACDRPSVPPPSEWTDRVRRNAQTVESILNSEEFKAQIVRKARFFYSRDTGSVVWQKISSAGTVALTISFFSDRNTRAIACSGHDGTVAFNIEKEKQGAASVGNIAHEVMHVLGYSHFTNFAWPNRNSVPYWVGSLAEQFAGRLPALQ